ncbi:hypothetical protein EJB05_50841, partial [Eragrostis curvula]
MAGALVSASTGVMESLLCKLSSVLEKGYRRNKRVEKDILFLRNELGSMNAVMKKQVMSKNPDLQVKAWMKELRELAYDIEDVIDAFMLQVEEKSDQPTGIMGFISSSISKLREFVSSSTIAQEIEELKHQVLEASDRRKRYKLDEYTSMDTVEAIDPRLTALYAEMGALVGVDGPRNKIIKLLTEGDLEGEFGKQLIKLVSIVGFGGMGKTTLANQVYQKIKGLFDCTCFVFVSQRPNMKKILVDLLSELGSASNMWEDEIQLINRIRDFLHDKRFLIVIDDIWSISAWEILKCALPENCFGSCIITTTRILDVATSCCSSFNGNIYRIEPLNDKNARKLFCKRIFHTDSCPTHLEGLSKAILRKCGGLPLAILHIASLLATKSDTKDEWELVLNSIGSALENSHTLQGTKKILLLSFYDLPPHLKTCLLYLSIYPEDYKIATKGLIMRLIAEGFIAEERGKRLDQVAQSYINDLINRSMVLPVDIGYDGHVQSFQVHDLVLNIIQSMSAEENFVTIIDGQQSSSLPKKIRRLSLHINDSEDALMGTTIANQNYVRSLTIFGFTKKVPSFSHFHALRVLHLGYCEWLENHHIECVCNMLQLRYLVIHSNLISELPEEIGNLQHLVMLNVKFCSIQVLPEAVAKLRKLVWLYVSGVKIPVRIGNMQCLEELSYIRISSNCIKFAEELGLLRKLRHLGITVEDPCEMEDHGRRYREALLSSIYQLGRHNLQSLSFDYRGHEDFILDSSMGSCFAAEHLQQLVIQKPLSRIPTWMSSLVNLIHLDLNISRMDADDINILKHIATLVFLRLVFTGNVNSTRIVIEDRGFEYLKEFHVMCFISGMWLRFAPGAMPKLQRYHLTLKLQEAKSTCDDFDLGLKHLESLQHVSVAIVPVSATNMEATVVAEAAIRKETSIHPNQPIVEIGTWQ